MQDSFNDNMMTLPAHFHGKTLAIAVSGGADSMALLLMAHEASALQGGKVIALTVDHGLRAESADEAKQVGAWCETRKIEHHTLRIQDAGFRIQGKQEEARDARYALLTGWCKTHHVPTLLTAHHRGDQVETLFFRLARGSNLRGLSCMAAQSELDGIKLIRPLLSVSKKELIAYLKERGQLWIEDPSNRKMTYTRNSIRVQLQSLPNALEIEERASAMVESFSRFREKLDAKITEASAQSITHSGSMSYIHSDSFSTLPQELGFLLLARLIQQLTGNDHPPRTGKLERLHGWLLAPDGRETTLAHLRFVHEPQNKRFSIGRAV